MSVQPYQDIVFSRDGDIGEAGRDRLMRLEATDLVLFAHGRNNSPATAAVLHSAFFAPFPGLLAAGVRLGYAGIVWPSMRFADEPVPGTATDPAADPGAGADRGWDTGPDGGLDGATRSALTALFPGHEATVARLAALLRERPESRAAFTEFGRLARLLSEAPAGGLESCFTDDLPQEEQGPPALLYEDTLDLCRMFALALERTGRAPAAGTGGAERVWRGAKELLRQTTYYAMKRRAGAVGELGLGPLLGQLARGRPGIRVHLVGHSQGARLVAFALRGLPDGVRTVKSVTLLQGAFSHYAFAPSLPHAAQHSGALRAMEQRVDGPVVACHSRYDSALGEDYPLASRLAGDDRHPVWPDRRWWAVGHSGLQAVRPPSVRLTLEEALARGVPRSGCVSVDTASVVRRGGAPAGAHSDICHRELARLIVLAGRMGG
ncbi:serine-threonine protein kinase [Streptomyces sp. NPDC001985]|uniref:serine-threonine protein kinase n=1 Tax=Streptomyces sp. NPDC001985 TaxID=3154406 RepID=UPI0033347B42